MIKKIIIPVVAMILLSSCANKYSLIKRKYGKGYYVSVTKNNTDLNQNKMSSNTLVKTKINKNVEESVSKSDNETIVSSQNNNSLNSKIKNENMSVLTHQKSSNSVNTSIVNRITASAVKHLTKSSASIKPIVLSDTKSLKNNANKGGNADTNTILLVILSLFPILALIAIYLKDGKKITLNFWIDLLLHFLVLYWLFAILVVLDIINFA